MTTPLDSYAMAGQSPDWSYRFAGRAGTAFEILFVGLFFGLMAGLLSGALDLSARNLLSQPEPVLLDSDAVAGESAGILTGILIDVLIGTVAGAVMWSVLIWIGLRRMVVGTVVILACWLSWTIVVMIAYVLYQIAGGLGIAESMTAMQDLIGSSTPGAVIFQLTTFFGIWPGTWAALRILHKQPFGTLFSPEGQIRWGDFWRGVLLAGVFWAITMAIGVAAIGMPTRTDLELTTWLIAFVPLVLLIFMQASGEELIFRGYFLQQLAARFRNPMVWGFLPAFLFGLAHYSSGAELGIGWYYVTVTLLFGVTASALVWRTGSLAAAMGLHTGMNVFALSTVGLEGIIEGTQLFLYDGSGAKTLFIVDGVATLAILLFVLSPWCPIRAREPSPAAV